MAVTSDKLFRPPMDPHYVLALVICGSCALISLVSSVRLFRLHLRAGRVRSGCVTPDEEAVSAMMFVMSIPAFAILSFLAVVLVEMTDVWSFTQNLIMAKNLAMIPGYFTGGHRGTLQLQLRLRERAEAMGPLQIYGRPPCCCLRLCFKPRTPSSVDIPRLKQGIWQFCAIVPVSSFIQLILAVETIMGASWVGSVDRRPGLLACRIVRVASQLTCMSHCNGLLELVAALSENPERKEMLRKGLVYCRSYLMGLNLIPTMLEASVAYLLGSLHLSNQEVLSDTEMTSLCRNVCMCLASIIISCTAWRAFPPERDPRPLSSQGSGLALSLL